MADDPKRAKEDAKPAANGENGEEDTKAKGETATPSKAKPDAAKPAKAKTDAAKPAKAKDDAKPAKAKTDAAKPAKAKDDAKPDAKAKTKPRTADQPPVPSSVVPVEVKKAEKKQNLRERSFGHSGQMVSEMTLGTWGLTGEAYGPVYHREVDRVIDRAVELGVTLFDTADVYQVGKMEEKLAERLDPETHRVITKIGTDLAADPPRKRFDAEYLREAFDKSRERLQRDKIDCVLLHNPSLSALEQDETIGFMRDLKKDGEVEFWGVSCGNGDIAEKAVSLSVDAIMLAYNVFHQNDLHRIADEIAASETAVLARSVLSHGLLAGHWSKTKMFFDNDHRSKRWSKEQLQYRIHQLSALRNMIGGEVITLRAAALRFVLANGLVTSAVLGVRSVTQLNQLIHEAGEGPPYLEDTLLAELPARLEAVGVQL